MAIVASCMSVLAGQMGRLRMRLASQKAELQRTLDLVQEIAIRDELTGLFNRRRMRTLIVQVQEAELRTGVPFTLAMFDVDRFKNLNDTYGHRAGDEALRQFAECLQTSTRASDFLARWGGEEFLLLLPQTPADVALGVVERMRQAMAATSFDSVAPGVRVTFSAGISESAGGDTIEAVVERADAAMYLSKMQGRDRCVVARRTPS